MKQQEEVTARDLFETHKVIGLHGEFKATIIRILTGLEKKKETSGRPLPQR